MAQNRSGEGPCAAEYVALICRRLSVVLGEAEKELLRLDYGQTANIPDLISDLAAQYHAGQLGSDIASAILRHLKKTLRGTPPTTSIDSPAAGLRDEVRCALKAEVPSSAIAFKFGLTETEINVIRRVCKTSSHKMAASKLGIATNTLRHHLGCIAGKMGARGKNRVFNIKRKVIAFLKTKHLYEKFLRGKEC